MQVSCPACRTVAVTDCAHRLTFDLLYIANYIAIPIQLCELIALLILQQVYAATVPLLTDEQLKQLGVVRMGDRASLVQACKRTCLGKH